MNCIEMADFIKRETSADSVAVFPHLSKCHKVEIIWDDEKSFAALFSGGASKSAALAVVNLANRAHAR